jgi:hypothetical protein
MLGVFKKIDDALMRLVTYDIFYVAPNSRPQTRIALLATLIPLEIVVVARTLQNDILVAITFPLWVLAVYQWRLWYRLRIRKVDPDE